MGSSTRSSAAVLDVSLPAAVAGPTSGPTIAAGDPTRKDGDEHVEHVVNELSAGRPISLKQVE